MRLLKIPFYLLAVAAYPLLFLYANNLDYVTPLNLVRPLVVSLLVVLGGYFLLSALLHTPGKAALVTALLWAAFSLYGHLYQSLRASQSLLSTFGRHSLLAPVVILLAAACLFLLLRRRGEIRGAERFLNPLLLVFLALPLLQLANSLVTNRQSAPVDRAGSTTSLAFQLKDPGPDAKPDVYYIILDTYSRADVIRKETGLDTAPFLDELRRRGFVVADCSLSNYDSTRVSLTSSLNMDYLPALDPRFTRENENNGIMDAYIRHSRVRSAFESLGYQTVAFATGFSFTEITDADRYLAPPQPSLLDPAVQPFESLWLKTTALRLLFDLHPSALSGVLNWLGFPHQAHVDRQLYLLDRLPELAAEPGPKFVFAHVLLPHVPLVFRADGSIQRDDRYFRETFDQPVSREVLVDGYVNQVEYLNRRLLEIIDTILRESKTPPVIILQGDHGLLYADHNPILNAYYLPGLDAAAVDPAITPVNTFRLLFEQYFGADLPLLPDKAYTSSYSRPYDFQLMQYNCPVE